MTYYFVIIFTLYLLFTLIIYATWKKIPSLFQPDFQPNLKVSVIIPVRNEAGNIQTLLLDLQNQSYPLSLLEVIVVNDHSTDTTEDLAKALIEQVNYRLIVTNLKLPEKYSGSSKKKAISQAIEIARGEVIVTTDGDCRAGSNWLLHLCFPFQQLGAVLVAGPVSFSAEKSFFQELQTIEFASLIVTGAVALTLNRPNMCNGANLAYLKSAFSSVGGYQGNEQIASGDDEFLLQKISKHYPATQLMYQKSQEALIYTEPPQNWWQFSQQRKRWAGKWKKHGNPLVMILAIFIFIFHVSFISAVIYLIGQPAFNLTLFLLILLKILLEFILLKNALEFLNKKLNLLKFMVLQFLYPFYVIYFGLAANFGSFKWKGRTYKN